LNNINKFTLDYFGNNLSWWQQLYIRFCPSFICSNFLHRGTSKSGLEFINLLEKLKKKAKTLEEREYYEQMQKEWGNIQKSITLGYWS
jgi:hypothetical protein